MPYRIDTYTDENVFSNTFGDTYTQTVWDSSCGDVGTTALSGYVTGEAGTVWTLTRYLCTDVNPITLYIDGVECETFTTTGSPQSIEMKCVGGYLEIDMEYPNGDGSDVSALYFQRNSGSGGLYMDLDTLNIRNNQSEDVSGARYVSIHFFLRTKINYLRTVKNMSVDGYIGAFFYNQINLEECNITDADTNMSLYEAFMYCEALKTLTFPKELPLLNTLNFAFYHTYALTSVDLPDMPMLEIMSDAFLESGLVSIDTPELPNVTTLYQTFTNSESLVSVKLNKLSGKLTNMENTFGMCYSLETIEFNQCDFSGVTSFYFCFIDDEALTSIEGDFSGISADVSFNYSPLDIESARRIINALSEVTESRTLTFSSTTYDLLEDSDFENATEKGWSVVRYR